MLKTAPAFNRTERYFIAEDELRAEFSRLVEQFYREQNPYSSFPEELAMLMPYLQIIALGKEAIPLLLEELERRPHHWFLALQALTGENPVRMDQRADFRACVDAWLDWGRSKGYLDRAEVL